MSQATRTPARELRGQIREWRRGRADARLVDVLGDVYVALFATVMLGSIAINVVLGVGRLSDDACASAACTGSRSLLPVLVALAVTAAVATVAGMLGPVFVSPAVGVWLMPTPVDRGSLLRSRLLTGVVGVGMLGALATAAGTVLGGWSLTGATMLTGAVGLLVAGLVGVAARLQSSSAPGLRLVTWLPGAALWCGLLAVALDLTTGVDSPDPAGQVVGLVLVASLVVATGGVVGGVRSLGRLARRDVSRGGALAPGISGALASLDLALAYDVVVEHRWRGHLPVRSRRPRRGPRVGAAALVAADVTRVLRSPRLLLVPAAAVVVAYAAEAAGAGRVVVLVAPLVGFVTGLPLLVGLRVLERTPSLTRMLPFPAAYAKGAAVVVPGVCFLLLGLATTPVLADALDATPGAAVILALAVGASSLAAAVRWVTGRPPDYGRPLVSTPAGGVPTNLYGSIVRGIDVLVLTTAPLLLVDDHVLAAEISLVLSAFVVSVLLGRPERQAS